MVVTMFFLKCNSQLQICYVKKESHIDGVYDADTEVYTIPKKKDLKVQPVYLSRNEIFIAHSKCVHAGCEASTRKSRVKRVLLDEDGEKKVIADVSLYFYFTMDDEKNYGAKARKVQIEN